jgi:hypothetical protein
VPGASGRVVGSAGGFAGKGAGAGSRPGTGAGAGAEGTPGIAPGEVEGTGFIGVVSPAGIGPASDGKVTVFGFGLSGTKRLRRGEYMSSYIVPQPAMPAVKALSRTKKPNRDGRDMPAGLLERRAARQLPHGGSGMILACEAPPKMMK